MDLTVVGFAAEASLKGRLAIERAVTGSAGNALGTKCFYETISRRTAEGSRVIPEDVQMVGVSRDAIIDQERPDTLDVGQEFRQQGSIP